MNLTSTIQINCYPTQTDFFVKNQGLAIIDFASYTRLLELLTPEQRASLHALATTGQFTAIRGRFA